MLEFELVFIKCKGIKGKSETFEQHWTNFKTKVEGFIWEVFEANKQDEKIYQAHTIAY
jgi:hypothetical protein